MLNWKLEKTWFPLQTLQSIFLKLKPDSSHQHHKYTTAELHYQQYSEGLLKNILRGSFATEGKHRRRNGKWTEPLCGLPLYFDHSSLDLLPPYVWLLSTSNGCSMFCRGNGYFKRNKANVNYRCSRHQKTGKQWWTAHHRLLSFGHSWLILREASSAMVLVGTKTQGDEASIFEKRNRL